MLTPIRFSVSVAFDIFVILLLRLCLELKLAWVDYLIASSLYKQQQKTETTVSFNPRVSIQSSPTFKVLNLGLKRSVSTRSTGAENRVFNRGNMKNIFE